MYFLFWRAPNQTQYSKCSITSVAHRERITFLDLLIFYNHSQYVVSLVGSKVQWCLMFNSLFVHQDPKVLFCKAVFCLADSPGIFSCIDLLYPRCKALHLPLLYFMGLHQPVLHPFQSPSVILLSSIWTVPFLSLVSYMNFLRTLPGPLSKPLVNTLTSITFSIDL